jgi:uncharacterized protein with PIN domain
LAIARFLFDPKLEGFLPRQRRGGPFDYACARAATLKNAVEALGVPHTEAARIRVNGTAATLDRIVRDGDLVEVDGWERQRPPFPLRFLADAHLGGLARFLRMLGFDTLHENAFDDAEIRRLAHDDRRIVLTRDRELLKCRDIAVGCYVHALPPEAQLREVSARFDIAAAARPFTLCLHCNLALQEATLEQAKAYAPAQVVERHRVFRRCPGCARIYWPGSHHARMKCALDLHLSANPGDVRAHRAWGRVV